MLKGSRMVICVLRETAADERRVALSPAAVAQLIKIGSGKAEVRIESGAGVQAGFEDAAYQAKGATITDRAVAMQSADILLAVRLSDAPLLRSLKKGTLIIAHADPLAPDGTA